MSSSIPPDKRAHPRHTMMLLVEYPGRDRVRDFTENLSAGGLFVRTDLPLKVGERLTLQLSFAPLLPRLGIEVEVVRVRPATATEPAGVGARVPDDRPEDRKKLSHLAAASSSTRQRQLRILVVEDNRLLAKMFSDSLRNSLEKTSLVTVETAENGQLAMERLMRSPLVTLVVSDLHMPVMDGFALLKAMRAVPHLRRLPVVAVTGEDSEEADALVTTGGAALVLRKPVKVQELVVTVQALATLAMLPE